MPNGDTIKDRVVSTTIKIRHHHTSFIVHEPIYVLPYSMAKYTREMVFIPVFTLLHTVNNVDYKFERM